MGYFRLVQAKIEKAIKTKLVPAEGQTKMEIGYPYWLTIAAIHASIVAIFIAASFAYLLFLYGRLDELKSSVYQEANKINRLRFASSLGLKIEDKYVCNNDKTRMQLAGILANIALTGMPQLGVFQEKDLSVEEKKEVGTEAIKIMDALSSYYPFPQRLIRGPKGETYIANKPIKVKFTSIEDVWKWRNDVYLLAVPLLHFWDDRRERFLNTIQPALEEYREFFEGRNINPEVFVNTFFQNISKAQLIANSTEEKLMAWTAYQKRIEIKRPLIIVLALSILAFVLGVFFPIVGWIPPKRIALLFLLAPFICYFFLFFYLFCKVLSQK